MRYGLFSIIHIERVFPPDAIVYTLTEAEILAHRSEWTKKIAHEAKKAAGAKVIQRLPSAR